MTIRTSDASLAPPSAPTPTSDVRAGLEARTQAAASMAPFGNGGKTSLQLLNEFCQMAKLHLEDELLSREDSPPGHFAVRLSVMRLFPREAVVTGTGAATDKKQAKQRAASVVLQALLDSPSHTGLVQTIMRKTAAQCIGLLPTPGLHGTSAPVGAASATASTRRTQAPAGSRGVAFSAPSEADEDYVDLGDTTWSEYPHCQQLVDKHLELQRVRKTPKQLLHELGQAFGFDARTEEVNMPTAAGFHYTATIADSSGRVIATGRGTATNKGSARQHAAAAAIEGLLSGPEYRDMVMRGPGVYTIPGGSAIGMVDLAGFPLCQRRLEMLLELGPAKTPAMLLNEHCQRNGLSLCVQDSSVLGPFGNPTSWECNITLKRPGQEAAVLEGTGSGASKAVAKHQASAMLMECILGAEQGQVQQLAPSAPAASASRTSGPGAVPSAPQTNSRDMPWLEDADAFARTRAALSGPNSFKTPAMLINDMCTARSWSADYTESISANGGFACSVVVKDSLSGLILSASTSDFTGGPARSKKQAKQLAASLLFEAFNLGR